MQNRDFEYELLVMFARNEMIASLAVPVLALVFAITLLGWAPEKQLLLWLATIFISKGILLALCRQFQKQPREDLDLPQWRRNIVAAEFLYGVCWAAVAFVEFPQDNQSAYFFLFAALVVVTAIRILFAATVLPILHAGTVPITAALVLRFLLTGEPFYWVMAAVAVGIHLYFVFLVKELQSNVLSMLDYRAEKESLIRELEQAKAASDEARRKAEAANFAKSKFLANMSHELRTPLNAILGFSEIMKDELLGPIANETYRGYAGDIHKSGQHLLKLINEILDLSRIEAGRYELREEAVDLREIAAESRRLVQLDADGKGIAIVDQVRPDLPLIWADRRAVHQICLNLLSNALKFTPAGGAVYLRIGLTRNGEPFLAIIDTGHGIPKEEIPQVLSTFGQGSLALKMNQGGTGLGLPIVKGLAELHGGRFELRSEPGRGTEAIAIFPANRIMRPRASGRPPQDFRRQQQAPKFRGAAA